MRTLRSRCAARRARPVAVFVACGAGTMALVSTAPGARATSAQALAARAGPALYYETQTGPVSFAIDELHLSGHRSSTQVVGLSNANVFGIALGGRSLYWSTQSGPRDRGSIMRVSLAGGRPHRLVGGLRDPGSVTAANGYVYWVDHRAIGRVALNGSHLQRTLISLPRQAGAGVADGLAANDRHLYFSRCADDTIGRADLDGRHVDRRFISTAARSCPQGLAATTRHIFWTELGRGMIGRASLDGRDAEMRWFNTHSRKGPFQLAVGGGHMYWTWGGVNGGPSYTGRADTGRSHLDRRFLPDSMYAMAYRP